MAERGLRDLVAALTAAYHAVVPGLFAEADAELAARGGARAFEARAALAMLFDDVQSHVAKEESVVFPWILAGRAATAGTAIRGLQLEHRDLLEALGAVVRLAEAATGGGRGAWLAALASALRAHVEVEDAVLFPRALIEPDP